MHGIERQAVDPRCVVTRCQRCGGSCIYSDEDGLLCLNCGRPCEAPRPVLTLVPDAADMVSVIARERRFIDAQVAAGKRAWSS